MSDLVIPDLTKLEKLDRFEAVGRAINEAESKRLFTRLPKAEEEFLTTEMIDARVRTVRTRLFLLGYLKEDSGSGEVDKQLRDRIREFQEDASKTVNKVEREEFKVDGWVGLQTWTALSQLVGFEEETRLDRWMDGDELGPALRRAVVLRFKALGFLKPGHEHKDADLYVGVNYFHRAVNLLKLSDQPVHSTLSKELLSVLFDQDGMVERLARNNEAIDIDDTIGNDPHDPAIVANFLLSMAKVELWLHGYQVKLEGVPVMDAKADVTQQADVYRALCEFWEDSGLSEQEAAASASKVDGRLFAGLLAAPYVDTDAAPPPLGEAVYEKVLQQDKNTVQRIVDFIKTLGSRLWDGIKRVGKWIVSFFKKAATIAYNMVRNLARMAYALASKAFGTIITAVKAMYHAAKFVLQPVWEGSDEKNLALRHDTDFDFTVFVNQAGESKQIQHLADRFLVDSRMTALGFQVFAFMVGTLVGLMKRAVPIFGTFAFVLSCARIIDKIKAIGKLVSQYQALQAAV